MKHPFAMNNDSLAQVKLTELSQEQLSQVSGGDIIVISDEFKEGGYETTQAIGEEGGDDNSM